MTVYRELPPSIGKKNLTLALGAAIIASPSVFSYSPENLSEQSYQAGPESVQSIDDSKTEVLDDDKSPVTDFDMRVLVVDDGESDDRLRFKDALVAQVFENSTQIIRDSTDGEINFDLVSIEGVDIPPTGTAKTVEGEEKPCYDTEALWTYVDQYRQDRNLGSSDTIALFLNSAPECHYYNKTPEPAGAQYTQSKSYSYYSKIDRNMVIHELNHIAGLSHSAIIDCTYFDSDEGKRINQPPKLDDINSQIDRGCGPRKHHDGEVDRYSSPFSVMGKQYPSQAYEYGKTYSYLELNKLAPERFKIQRIEPSEVMAYELSMGEGGIAGVSIPLPQEHSLREINPTIDEISFGLVLDVHSVADNPDSEPGYIIMPMADDETGQTYLINTMDTGRSQPNTDTADLLCNLGSDDNHVDAPIIYIDESMDVVVSARRCNGRYFVDIDTFANTEQKRLLADKAIEDTNNKVGDVATGINKIASIQQNS